MATNSHLYPPYFTFYTLICVSLTAFGNLFHYFSGHMGLKLLQGLCKIGQCGQVITHLNAFKDHLLIHRFFCGHLF